MATKKERFIVLKGIYTNRDEKALFLASDLKQVFTSNHILNQDGELIIGELRDLGLIDLLGGYKGKNGVGFRTIRLTKEGMYEVKKGIDCNTNEPTDTLEVTNSFGINIGIVNYTLSIKKNK